MLPIAEFAYNNVKNTSICHISFELNCEYHPRVFFENETNPYSRSHFIDELAKKLRELIEICYQNLLHV